MKIEGNQKELDAMVEFHKGIAGRTPRKITGLIILRICACCKSILEI